VTALYTAVPPFPARRRPAPSPTLPTCANARPADAPFEPFTRVDTAADLPGSRCHGHADPWDPTGRYCG